jgi:hypothetical protein
MSKKPAIIGLGIFVALVIIALIIYLFTRPSKSSETEDKPTVKDAGIELVLNPADKTDKVEEYSIFTTEYAIGETTAKNIDILLKWTNGPNFATVKSLIFIHKANGKEVRDSVTTEHNIQSNKSYEILFKGADLTSEDIVGDNTIGMYYTTEYDAIPIELTTISFRIEEYHLDTTLKSDIATPIVIQVKLSSSSEASSDIITTYTKYLISLGGDPYALFAAPVRIRTNSGNNGFHIMKNNTEKHTIDGVDTFYIVKALSREFISKDASGNYILNGNQKFVSKDDIFGDINVMNSSSIQISIVDACSFVLPIDSTADVHGWFGTTKNKNKIKKRCEDKADACGNSGKFFTQSDFAYTPTDCSSLPSYLKNICTSANSKYETTYANAKTFLIDKEYRDMCKTT